MRKKIYRLSEGQFNRSVSLVSAEPSEIDIECREGILCEGSFMVKSGDDTGLKGVVYSSNPCVICPNPSFEGNECSIRFCTIHNGFKEGDELKGGFTVITDGAKLTIPYSIRFTSSCLDASTGPIRDLSEYTAFAEEHWNEALRLFRTEDFESMIERTDNKLMPLYQGYKNALPNSKNLEGFLTAVGVKPRVSFEVDRKELSYYGIRENLKESLKITRSGWGYIEIEVSCDADYITVDTNRITPDFFLGSTMELSFFIHKDKLHDGKNPASITLSGGGERRVISIVASRNEKDAYVHMADLKNDRKWLEVFKLYERYRLRQCTTGEWCAGSVELLDALYADDDSPVYPLIKAHALIVNKQRQDALWLIQDLRQTIEDKRSAEWAYLLYLCTLIEPEEEYVDKLTAEIENIFLEEESLYIFWFLLFLRKEYLSDFGRKLSDIRKWVKAGYPSPLLYIEAYDLYCQDPFLLKRFDDFSMKVLGWVRKHDGMTGNLAIRITHLVEEEKEYKEEVYELAAYTYSRYPDDNLLTAIIRLLLLGSRTGEKYLSWYTAGIEKELKVTGIFEAYILSLPRDYVDPLPRPVLLYFNYQNTLPARSKAFIYANIIMHKKDSRETYEQYISQMETFALAEMREGHIDDNLAIVYQELLDHNVMDEDVALAMSKLFFVNRLVCVHPDARRVIVYEDSLDMPFIARVIDHAAYVPLYTNNYRILLELSDGTLLNDDRACYAQELLQGREHYEKLSRLSPDKLPFFVYDLATGDAGEILDSENLKVALDFLMSDRYSDTFKRRFYPRLIEAAKEHTKEELLTPYFLSLKDYRKLDTKTCAFILELFIRAEEYDAAERMLRSINCNGASGKLLLKLINEQLKAKNRVSDDLYISLSAMLMNQFLTSEETIDYLNEYFVGATPDMVTLWKFADARQLDTASLEERILTQLLYTEDIDDTADPIFLAYLSHKPNAMIVEAYLTLFADRFLTEGIKVPETVFEQLKLMHRRDERLNEACRLSLLCYYSKKGRLSDTDMAICDELLSDAVRRNIYFAFYRSLDERLLIRYHLYDKLFVEYRGSEGMRLYISSSYDGGEERGDEMTEMYDGIYVHQYMVFLGEKLNCRVYEAGNEAVTLLEGEYTYQDVIEDEEESRYQLINRMQSGFLYQNEQELLTAMKRYQGLSVTTENLFKTL